MGNGFQKLRVLLEQLESLSRQLGALIKTRRGQ